MREDAPANATGAAVAGTGDDPVHWRGRGVRAGFKGRKNKVGRSISALNFIKMRNKMMANTNVKSSYPAGSFKVEENNPRIARKSGQPAKSDKHSDLYTDEDPKGTIHGLKFATVQDAKDSVSKIKNSSRTHAHKIQAAVAMEQRAIAAGKRGAAAIYRVFINKMKKKTKEMQKESLYANIHKKRREGRPMRKKGAKGAPKPSDFDRAARTAKEEAPVIGGIKMKKLGKGKPGGYKSLVLRHLGSKAAEKIDKSDGSRLVAKGKKTGNTDLIRKGNFIKNVIGRK
jgi:superfamily II DNA/RNA helicase